MFHVIKKFIGINRMTINIKIFSIIITVLCAFTIQRNFIWTDRIALWTDNSNKSPAKHRVRLNLSAYYFAERRYARSLDEAQQAIITEPDKVTGYINGMSAALKLGAYELAYDYGLKIMAIRPMKVTAQNLEQLALVLGKKGEEVKIWQEKAGGLEDVKRLSLAE